MEIHRQGFFALLTALAGFGMAGCASLLGDFSIDDGGAGDDTSVDAGVSSPSDAAGDLHDSGSDAIGISSPHDSGPPDAPAAPALDAATFEASADAAADSNPPDASICTPFAPVTFTCGSYQATAPGQYCDYQRSSDPRFVGTGTPSPTPTACQCVETYNCACLGVTFNISSATCTAQNVGTACCYGDAATGVTEVHP